MEVVASPVYLGWLGVIMCHATQVGDELQVETTTTAAAETIATTIPTTSTSLTATLPPESTTSDQEINPSRSSVREPDNQIATDTRTTTPAIGQSAALNFDTDTIGGIAGGLVVLVCAALAVLLSVVLCRRRRAHYSTKGRSAGKEMAEPHSADTAVRAKLGTPGDYEETYPTKDEKPHEAEGADEAVYECIPGKDSDGRKENIYECPSDAKGMSNMSQEDIYECI